MREEQRERERDTETERELLREGQAVREKYKGVERWKE
jgi:hypothetical protein